MARRYSVKERIERMKQRIKAAPEDLGYLDAQAREDVQWLISLVVKARKVIIEGLKYHEHDGHDMPKRVARDALRALGIPDGEQP